MKATVKAPAGMNLRAGPGSEHDVIGRLQPGSWVQVYGRDGEWAQTAGGYLFAENPAWVELEEDAQPPKPAAWLPGVDVSHWQGEIDWRLMQEQGVEVAGIKVTEGTVYVDPRWRENHKWARAYGIRVFPYHFYINPDDPLVQARHFRSQYQQVDWDYDAAGDFEDNRLPAGNLPAAVHSFMQHSGAGTVYTNASWWNAKIGRQDWADQYRLWVANWEVDKPQLPAGWSDWWGWQYRVTDNGEAYGVESARLDLDWFKEPEWGPLTHWPVNSRALSVGGNPWSEGHQALDLAARMGDPVFAAHSGQVTEVGYQDDGYGHYITIAGLENGVSTLYAHLSRVDVAEGDIIDGGQRIGAAGSTGASTGPHLHFELVEDGGRVNAWPELQRVK